MSTDAGRWKRIKAVFQDTFDREPVERDAYLDAACAGDAELRAAVQRLLDGHANSDAFLDAPLLASPLMQAADGDGGLSIPVRIGPYRVTRELGRGGMGAVYLAERDDPNLRKIVAIKVVQRDSYFMLRRFRTETQILAALEHPGIARLYDGGTTEDGLPYFVMEYVAGENILAYCDAHQLPIRERLQLFRHVCDAVQFAHQSLIVHRDLKPSNILVTTEGEPKLLDFGIAKLLNPELTGAGQPEETIEAARLLTPQYASPEHVRGQPVTTASDVYSLGLILYELLCGARPYRITGQQSTAEIERTICETDAPAPSSVAPARVRRALRGDLDTIVLKALLKEPAQRYGTATELADDVRRHLEGFPVLARPNRMDYRAGRFVRRHRAAVTAAAAAMLSLVVGLGVAIWQARVTRTERDRARSEADKARQIATFLSNIFQGSNPMQARGNPITTRELLDRGTASIQADLKDQPEIQASLLLVLSSAYTRASAVAEALATAERAHALRTSLFPADSLEVAESGFSVGLQLRRLGRHAEALPYLEHALTVRDLLDPNSRAVAESLAVLTLAREALGQTTGTREMIERAIRIEEQLEPRSARLAYLLNTLAVVLENRGDQLGARGAYERSIAIYDGSGDPENAGGVAMPLENLGVLLTKQEDFVTAERLFDRVLAIEMGFGAESAGVAYVYGCMGELARAEGDLRRARMLVERGLRMYAKLVPPDHIFLAEFQTYFARTLVDEGRADEAVTRLETALRISEKADGPEHPDVAEILIDLARARMRVSGRSAGEPLLRRALAIQRRALPADHPSFVRTLTALGELTSASAPAASKGLLEEAVLVARRRLPEKHSQRVAAEAALTRLQQHLSR